MKKYTLLTIVLMLSFIFSLLTAELILRGYSKILVNIYKKSQEPQRHWGSGWRKNKEVINIVALGDSYTFGGLGKSYDSYPSELERLLKRENSLFFSVSNQGVCRHTSANILSSLSTILTSSHPDLILMLVGSADLFDPYPFAEELMTSSDALRNFFQRLYIYKAGTFLYYKLERAAYLFQINVLAPKYGSFFKSQELISIFDKVEQKILTQSISNLNKTYHTKIPVPQNQSSYELDLELALSSYLQNRHNVFFELIEKIIHQIDLKNGFSSGNNFRERVGVFLLKASSKNFSQSSQLHLHALNMVKVGLSPNMKWPVASLLKAVSFNKLEARSVSEALKYSFAKYPYLKNDKRLASVAIAFRDREHWKRMVVSWYERNLEKIIFIMLQNGSIPVMQTYPISYYPINEIIRKLAKKHNLILVDHEILFAPLVAKNRSKYILDDDHCTGDGHRLMAENILSVLRKSIFSRPEVVQQLIEHGSHKSKYTQDPGDVFLD